jgi:hypothetical protein
MSLHRLAGAAIFICAAALAGAGAAPASELVGQLLSFFGISATPSQMKAPDVLVIGDIWIVDASRDARTQLTRDGGYSWPVFDPNGARILTLKRTDLFEIPLDGGGARRLMPVPGIVKLIGFDREQADRVLVLRADPNAEIAILSLATGQVTALATIRDRAKAASSSPTCMGRNAPMAIPSSTRAGRAAPRSPATCSSGPTCSSRKAIGGRGM